MRLVADLHIHSHYSRATSKDLTFDHLARWAQLKGVHIVGTGDIAHPGWLEEMRARLQPAEDGLFRLKDEHAAAVAANVPAACGGAVRFLLAGEISNIYKRHGAVRKVHNVICAPNLNAVARIQLALEKIGNIRSDGRPILGLDSRDLLEIILDVDPACCLIPAHIWTPWFSMLGSKSGFDSVEECFGDLTPHIFALETGLSSDPPMNWRVSNLDRYTLVSNSDAHSPQKLAREATLFTTELAYSALIGALRSGDPAAFGGTLEFFPEEGKYHLDGHRKCGVCWEPPETLAHGGICPVCGKEVTVGVMHRVEVLADRPEDYKPPRPHPYTNLVPLPEVLGEVYGIGPASRRVQQEYDALLGKLGPELVILLDAPLEDIAVAGGSRLAEAIGRMRRGEVIAEGGYDGEYGAIRIFALGAGGSALPQFGLFAEEPVATPSEVGFLAETRLLEPAATDAPAWTALSLFDDFIGEQAQKIEDAPAQYTGAIWLTQLNDEQRAAVACTDVPLLIVAGPGTGKTRTLTVRIAFLVHELGVSPESVLAITFTNKAAEELAARLVALVGAEIAGRVTVKTFHAFGVQLLRAYGARFGLPANFAIAGEVDRRDLLQRACPGQSDAELQRWLARISGAKNRLLLPDAQELEAESKDDPDFLAAYRAYQVALAEAAMLDFDDLVLLPVQLLERDPDTLAAVQARYRWISVDEYQDVNLAQVRLLRLLTADGANLCAIGDPDQAIYGFRGADRRHFLAFAQDYPGAKLLRLQQSYRSPQSLLNAAAQVIARSPDYSALALWSNFAEQIKLDVYQAPTDKAEAEYVVHRIEQMVGGTSYFSLDSGRVDESSAGARSFADFAVLHRLGSQGRLLIEALERSGIPYQAVGQAPLASHRDVRDLLAVLWLRANPRARLHLAHVLASGKTAWPGAAEECLWVLAGQAEFEWRTVFVQAAADARFTRGQRRRLADLAALWGELAQLPEGAAVTDAIRLVHAFTVSQATAPPSPAQKERLARLLARAAPYGDRPAAFLEALALQSEADAYDARADRVALMTLHAAKGLEFPVVFIVGCEEGLLPYLPPGRPADVEEERRLFYVGMTRARQKLILTHAARRMLFGQRVEAPRTRFVADIEAALLEVQKRAQAALPSEPEEQQLRLF